MFSPIDCFNKTTAQLGASLDRLLNLPSSKTLTKDEEKNVIASLASFNHTMKKVSRFGLIPPEMKDVTRNFEKAGYDITRMPREYSNSLKRTYEDLSYATKTDPGFFKDKASNAYCTVYELFTGIKFKNFVSKLKKSKTVSKILQSNESYSNLDSIESIDAFYADLDRNEHSEELFGPVRNAANQFLTLSNSVNSLTSIIIISVVIIGILICCMCIVSSMYQQRLVESIEALTEAELDQRKKGKANKAFIDKLAVAKAMENGISPATKSFMVSPMVGCSKFINKITEPKEFINISKGIDIIDKTPDSSSESLDQSQEIIGFGTTLAGAASAIGTFVAGNPIIIGVSIVAALILVIQLLRGAIYWIGHFRLKVGTILKEQSDTLDTNVVALIDKMNDPATPKSEKERLAKVIERQKNMSKNLMNLSEVFYKTQNTANSDTNYDLKDDEKIDFDKQADDAINQAENEEANSSPEDISSGVVVNETETPSTGSASIIF